MINLDRLEALAKAATTGPWTHGEKAYLWLGDERNQLYIAAANPAAVLELIEELRAKNDLLEEVFDDCGGKINDACPVCSTYTHKSWCWYPHLAKMLGKPLDEFDERFLAEEKKWATSN